MCKCKCWLSLVFLSKISKLCNNIYKLLSDEKKCITHDDYICIVAYVAACSSKVDNTCSLRTLLSVCIYMAHYIMSYFLLTSLSNIIIDILNMLLHLINHILSNNWLAILRKTKFHLCLSKCNPKSTPCRKLFILGENILHFLACISLRKWASVSICAHNSLLLKPSYDRL